MDGRSCIKFLLNKERYTGKERISLQNKYIIKTQNRRQNDFILKYVAGHHLFDCGYLMQWCSRNNTSGCEAQNLLWKINCTLALSCGLYREDHFQPPHKKHNAEITICNNKKKQKKHLIFT